MTDIRQTVAELRAALPEARAGFMADRATEAVGFLVGGVPELLDAVERVAALAEALDRGTDGLWPMPGCARLIRAALAGDATQEEQA